MQFWHNYSGIKLFFICGGSYVSFKFLIQLGFTMFLLDSTQVQAHPRCPSSALVTDPAGPLVHFPPQKSTSHIGCLGFTEVIAETAPCGAVRHGAECCNLYFPQELDDEYLIVWQGFSGKPWDYKTEAKPRTFDLRSSRAGDGGGCRYCSSFGDS